MKNIKDFIKTNKFILFVFFIITFLISIPIAQHGIVINDVLQYRIYSIGGFSQFWGFMIDFADKTGRHLNLLSLVPSIYFTFFSGFKPLFGLIEVLLVFTNVVLFAYLLYKFFNNIFFSMFSCVLFMIFLPFSYEHTLPGSYIANFCPAFSLLLLSLILFIKYIETDKKLPLYLSCVFLFVALTAYELFITFTPLFLIIILFFTEHEKHTFKNIVQRILPPFITSCIYLVIYSLFRLIYESQYANNILDLSSPLKSLYITVKFVIGSLPGFFLFDKKHLYIYKVAAPFPQDENLAEILIKHFWGNFLDWRIVLLATVLCIFMYFVFSQNNYRKIESSKSFLFFKTLGLSLLLLFIIPIPNSINQSILQLNVNEHVFVSSVTYFMMFITTFIIALILWYLRGLLSSKVAIPLYCVFLIIPCIFIQSMNSVISKEQEKGYAFLTLREDVLMTDTLRSTNGQPVFSTDMYQKHLSLAIQDNYWDLHRIFKGHNVVITKDPFAPCSLTYQDDSFFVLKYKNIYHIVSPKLLNGTKFIKINESDYLPVTFTIVARDGDFYRYSYSLVDNELIVLDPIESLPEYLTGSDLQTALKISGYYMDGWVTTDSKFKLETKENGIIILTGYYPGEINPGLTGYVLINNAITNFEITSNVFTLELSAPKNETVTIDIHSNFSYDCSDSRILSFVITHLGAY